MTNYENQLPNNSEIKGQLDAQTKITQNYHSKPFCYTTTATNFNNYLNHTHTSNIQNPQSGTTSFSGLRKVSKMNR